jgi:uncharacterized membrane protein
MKTEMKYGVIIALISAVWVIAQDLVGLHDRYIEYQTTVGWLSFIIPIAGLFFAIKDKRDKEFEGVISYGRCLKTGMLTSVVSGTIGAVFQLIFLNFINPGFLGTMKDYQRQSMLDNGMPAEQVDMAIGMMEFTMSPVFFTIMAFVGAVVGGLLISLILGAFLKKDPPPVEA